MIMVMVSSPCIMCVQCIGGCSVHRGMFSTSGDIMMHEGEQVGKNLSISIENPDVLNIPSMYS